MKKALLITTGIALLIIVLLIWVYLMFFGAPESPQEVFSDLGFDLTSREVAVTEVPVTEARGDTALVDTQGEALRQLTTRPVAGFVVFSDSSSDSDVVRYVERGTGHIYDINVATGEERRVSATTIPRVTEAVFSSDGQYVALTSVFDNTLDVFAGNIDTSNEPGTITGQNLTPGANEVYIENGEVYYTVADNDSTTGYRFDLDNNSQAELFSVPFAAINMIWEPATPLFYNRIASVLPSAVYSISGGSFSIAHPAETNRLALQNEAYTILTKTLGDSISATALEIGGSGQTNLGVMPLPEKCTFDTISDNTLFCAAPVSAPERTYIESWYKGVITSADFLWEINLENGEALLLIDPSTTAGRTIDVTNLQSDPLTNNLLFTNKLDNTLWLYDLLASS